MTTTTELAEPPQETVSAPDSARLRPSGSVAFRLPHGLTSIRFGLLIGAILVAGLVALLAVNTSRAAGAIELARLESALARKTEQQQALGLVVEELSSAKSLQDRAIALGMVPIPAPAFLDPATGRLSGALVQAQAGSAPNTGAPMVTIPEPPPEPPPTPGATGSPGTATAGIEPPARLVMPPDRGIDGATVTRPAPVLPQPTVDDLPDQPGAAQDGAGQAGEAQDGEPVLQGGEASDDAAAILGGER